MLVLVTLLCSALTADDAPTSSPVSYFKEIRPLFQKHCQGCHQPAKKGGELLLTSVAEMNKGGETGPTVVPGKPDEGTLVKSLLGQDLERMPKDAEPLPAESIELVKRWVAEGAKDDSPPDAIDTIDAEHPPVYEGKPLISALAFSRDGTTLAVGGYREILLHAADGSALKARLIGLSQRIEDLAYSPDGTRLAACGGSPGRFGEIQIWNVADNSLLISSQVSTDTLFGISWSTDQQRVVFGCPDNSCRVADAKIGSQLLKFDHHTDWVIGSVFSLDDKHIITVSRDRAVKLTESGSGAFIDNVTSITPGALTGGLESIERHPKRNEVVVGSVDGIPKLYRIYREKARQIGDDFNLIRSFPPMNGAVRDVDVSTDGVYLAAAGGSDVRVYEIDTGKQIASVPMDGQAYAVAIHPSGQTFAAAGYAGVVKLVELATGKVVNEFVPVPLSVSVAKN